MVNSGILPPAVSRLTGYILYSAAELNKCTRARGVGAGPATPGEGRTTATTMCEGVISPTVNPKGSKEERRVSFKTMAALL